MKEIDCNDLNNLMINHNRMMSHLGWAMKDTTDEHYLLLIIDEICEAMRADRDGLDPDYNKTYPFKDTVEDEMSDVLLRILNLMAVRDISIYLKRKLENDYRQSIYFSDFPENAYKCISILTKPCSSLALRLNNAIMFLFVWADMLGFDLKFTAWRKFSYNYIRTDWTEKSNRKYN